MAEEREARRGAAIEVHCFACASSTSVRLSPRLPTVSEALRDRGWRNDRGVVACRHHAKTTVMPRHRAPGLVRDRLAS